MKVLLVDDDIWQVELFEHELSRAGHAVSKANDVYMAIDIIDRTLPDAIILDLMLPGVNGIVLLHELRSHSDLSKIPIIVISSTRTDLKTLAVYGVRAVLDKASIHPGDLLATLSKVTR